MTTIVLPRKPVAGRPDGEVPGTVEIEGDVVGVFGAVVGADGEEDVVDSFGTSLVDDTAVAVVVDSFGTSLVGGTDDSSGVEDSTGEVVEVSDSGKVLVVGDTLVVGPRVVGVEDDVVVLDEVAGGCVELVVDVVGRTVDVVEDVVGVTLVVVLDGSVDDVVVWEGSVVVDDGTVVDVGVVVLEPTVVLVVAGVVVVVDAGRVVVDVGVSVVVGFGLSRQWESCSPFSFEIQWMPNWQGSFSWPWPVVEFQVWERSGTEAFDGLEPYVSKCQAGPDSWYE